ncbi:MAG TPA: UDP-3-O-(3-hydroxymyristoyl)glucosamine N-acyltransferase [Candidatus Acidoferrales bacterium]
MRNVGELAEFLGARINGDANLRVLAVANPDVARASDLIYVDSIRNQERALKSAALCVLVAEGTALAGKTTLEVKNPKFSFAKAASWLMPRPPLRTEIHPTAIVAETARLAAGIRVGPYVVIEDEVEIGAGSEIEAFCFLGRAATVGHGCRLHPRVTLYAGAKVKDRVELHSGVVIGGDGFGYVFGEGRHIKFPQIGSVEIGNDVEIGCNSTVDRGSLDATRIGTGVKIDNLVQIAHNVEIGENSIVAAQVGISGSSSIGENVLIGGQVGIADHCKVEDGAIVGAQAGIPTGKTIHRGQMVWGTPARPMERFKEQFGWLSRLPHLAERVRKLEEGNG